MLTQPIQTQYERCGKHPQNDIILFCLNRDCIEPLCKECCSEHIKWHNTQAQRPEIETVDSVRAKCVNNIHSIKLRFEEERSILKHFSDSENGELLRSVHAKLENVKANLLNMVNQYCQNLENQIKNRLQSHKDQLAHPGEKRDLHHRLNSVITNLDNQEKSMLQPRYLRSLLQVLTEEKNYDLESMMQEIDGSVRHYLSNMFDVVIYEDRLEKIKADLHGYVTVEEVNLEYEIEQITKKLRAGEAVYGIDQYGNPQATKKNSLQQNLPQTKVVRPSGSASALSKYEEPQANFYRPLEKTQAWRSPSNQPIADTRSYFSGGANNPESNKSRLKQKYDL